MKGWRTKEPIAVAPEKPRLLAQLAEGLYGVPVNCEKLAGEVGFSTELVREILGCYDCGHSTAPPNNLPYSAKVTVMNPKKRYMEGV
jgi:hypothetical protein